MSLFRKKSKIEKVLSIENETERIIALGQLLWAKSANDNDFESLNNFEKNILFIEMLESQVNNGGFDQYFFNSSGDYAHETVISLKQINAPVMAGLLEEAIEVFPKLPVPKDIEVRRGFMNDLPDSFNKKWNDLDNEFFQYPENLSGLVNQYVKENITEFN